MIRRWPLAAYRPGFTCQVIAALTWFAWYKSDAYQQILPLRTGNSQSDVIVVDGVARTHRATDILVATQ